MKKIVSVFILCLFALIMANCKKSHKSLPTIEMDTDSLVHRFFNYQPGSYWIYRDSIDGRTDSFFVRSNYYITQGAPNANYKYHFIGIAGHNIDGSNVGDSCYWVLALQGNKIMADYFYGRNGYGWKTDISYTPLVLYPFIYGDNNSSFDSAYVTGIDSFRSFNGLPFYGVAQLHQYINLDGSTDRGKIALDDVFSINDSVGIVKMALHHKYDDLNHVWEVVRHNVIKK